MFETLNPHQLIKRLWHWNDDKKEFIVETRQNCTNILEANKKAQNDSPTYIDIDGEKCQHIGRISTTAYFEIIEKVRSGNQSAQIDQEEVDKEIERLLQNSDYRNFRRQDKI